VHQCQPPDDVAVAPPPAAVPHQSLEAERVEAPGVEVVEWTYRGTHTGDIEGWPATGRPFEFSGCNVCRLEDGRIRREDSYWDWESLRSQA
jgi:steroid delta-isomerase-like uncharacterized protein